MDKRNLIWALLCLSLLVCRSGFSAQSPNPALIYKTAQAVTYTVTADGLTAVEFGGRKLATGSWTLFNAEGWFNAGTGEVKSDGPSQRSIEVLGDAHARVTHQAGDLRTVYDYRFSGEDLTISARVENNHPTADMNVVGFSGLLFNFGRRPEGIMAEQHITYFQAHGVGLCHPSGFDRIGGSYAEDDSVGVGLSPWQTGFTRTLILWDYTDWNVGKRELLPSRFLKYFVASTVPARGACTFDFRMRVSPNRDWKHLLAPYKEHFENTFGPVQYKADPRWIATDYLNRDLKSISPTNPYGFHDGRHRIDTPVGAELFCSAVIPVLKADNGQGIIVWGQGGEEPRGEMYRPDFDILPPEVERNWATIAAAFKAAGLRLGVTTRPGDIAVRLDWNRDEILRLNSDEPGHRAMLLRRFDNMIGRGCTLFYLDSFGNTLGDVKLMRWLRSKLGPDIQTFCEQPCDAVIPYSGAYSESTLVGAPKEGTPHYNLWAGLREWEIYRWLAPGAQMASRLYQVQGKPPADMESPDRFFARNGISPLLPVDAFARAPEIKALQTEFHRDAVVKP